MTHEFGVTIASDLELRDIGSAGKFPHVHVFDLRRCQNWGARPIDEATLKRMQNFWIDYDQLPIDMRQPTTRQENNLFRVITEARGSVMIVTDQIAEVAQFCRDCDIPFYSQGLYIVETGRGETPVVALKTPDSGKRYGRLAS